MSDIADRVAAAFDALQGRIVKQAVEICALEDEIVRLRQENDGLKNRVQILESMRVPQVRNVPDRVQLDEHRYIRRDIAGNWTIRTANSRKSLGRLNSQTNEIIDACLGYKP